MSEPSSRSLEQARELLHGRVFEEAQIAVALALDEIVALRQLAHDDIAATYEAIGRTTKEAYALGRAEALEAAAQLVESKTRTYAMRQVAAAIRELKDWP